MEITFSDNLKKKDKCLLDIALLAGSLLMGNGAETYRVEETVKYILSLTEHLRIDVMAHMTGIEVTLTDVEGRYFTAVRRIHNRNLNLEIIYQVNSISRSLTAGKMEIDEAYSVLSELEKIQKPATRNYVLGIFVCVAFTLMMGGGWTDLIAGFLGGCVLMSVLMFLSGVLQGSFMQNFASAFFVALTVNLSKQSILPMINHNMVIASVLMIQFPGTAVTNAIRDTMKGDYLSGMGRAMEAIVIAAGLAIGTGLGLVTSGGIFR